MKKTSIYFSILLGITFIFSHCRKDIGKDECQNSFYESTGISFGQKYLSFIDIDSYESFISNMNLERLEYLNRNNPSALGSVKGENTIDSLYEPELLSILSKDRTVRIGEWIIKVDLPNSTVLALNQESSEYYNDLLNNIPNERILAFKTTDNVLEILESGHFQDRYFKGLEGLICNERRADAKTDEDYCGEDYLRYCQVRYYSAGVYFSLYAKIFDYQTVYAGQQRTDFSIDIGFQFDDRCDRSYDQLSWATDSESWSFPAAGSSYKLKAYESGYALKTYELDGDFTVNIIDWYGQPGSQYESGTLSISDY